MRAENRTGPRVRRSLPTVLALLLAALVLLLAGCESGPNYAPLPTATTASAAGSPTSNPTPETISTPGAPVGIAGLCALAPSVSTQLPSDIPPYPSAQLRVGSNQNGAGLYGLCSTASVTDVNSFYVAKIPENGWKNMSSTSIGGTDQIAATKGTTTLTITILTDGQVSSDTDIIIVTGTSG